MWAKNKLLIFGRPFSLITKKKVNSPLAEVDHGEDDKDNGGTSTKKMTQRDEQRPGGKREQCDGKK